MAEDERDSMLAVIGFIDFCIARDDSQKENLERMFMYWMKDKVVPWNPTKQQLDAAVKSGEEHMARAASGDLGSFE